MKPLVKIFLYLFASVCLGVLIAPWIYQFVQLLSVNSDTVLAHGVVMLQKIPFHRYVSRSVQVVALLLLWPTITSLHIYRFSEISLYPNTHAYLDILGGIAAALLPLCLLEGFFLWEGWYVFNETILWHELIRFLGTACFVAVFEEFFFRGLLLGLCRRVLNDKGTAIFTALLFASVHFLNISHGEENSICWWSGFRFLWGGGIGSSAWPLMFDAFVNLFLLGIILAWVTLKTYSLWLAIGLHAAWIFGQQFFNLIAKYNVTPPEALFPWLGPAQIYAMVPVGLIFLVPTGLTILLLKKYLAKRCQL